MILVDTSVWIEFFRTSEPYFSELRKLLESSEVVVHEVIFGELLQGCRNQKESDFIVSYWENLDHLNPEGTFIQAGKLSHEKKYISKGIGLIDSVLINESIKHNLKVWTLDKKVLRNLNNEYIYTQ
ncbi:PIN domain-containing protein [Leptospira sp. GIMC2001]|uniref:PIN domain-containing protein n=1 Tax=Leptospira sp. GIMC2001 TaxID=1513297 RepID=UPI00234A887B|nr:PIN domain-containing protein [Leptospira sp. GIMC2001]WCL50709.1 PIN domain-containing protein [Leptospira sp. GIMC2001]